MPQRKNAIKQLKVDDRRRSTNNLRKKKVKEAVKTVKKAVEAKDLDTAKAGIAKAYKQLDKAGAKGAIHKNKVARLKSRMVKKVNNATA